MKCPIALVQHANAWRLRMTLLDSELAVSTETCDGPMSFLNSGYVGFDFETLEAFVKAVRVELDAKKPAEKAPEKDPLHNPGV